VLWLCRCVVARTSTHQADQSYKQEREAEAAHVGQVAVSSILRDWIKGPVTASEVGMLSFEGAFLGQILLPNG
jgi:hypothetical protein